MTGILGKIFGKSKKANSSIDDLVEDAVLGLIEGGNFDLSYEISFNDETKHIDVELFGEDEELLKERDGQLLDSIQLFATRVIQHQMPEEKFMLSVDCDGFREDANSALRALAEKLRDIVLKKEKPVYFRALPPKDRKVVHQCLADDERVKSQSVGDGLYKKIKIFPVSTKKDQRESARN